MKPTKKKSCVKTQQSISDFLNSTHTKPQPIIEQKIEIQPFIKKDSFIPKQKEPETDLWVDKYKPKLPEDILGNYKNVN